VDSLYREMHPNRHCGSHGRSLSVPALQVLRWRYWELRVLFDLPELVCGNLVYVLWYWDGGGDANLCNAFLTDGMEVNWPNRALPWPLFLACAIRQIISRYYRRHVVY
jgi:hypothetical protein